MNVQHWCRYVMNQHTQSIVKSLRPETLGVLEISGLNWVDYDPRVHSLANDPRYPVVVWGLGRRGRAAA